MRTVNVGILPFYGKNQAPVLAKPSLRRPSEVAVLTENRSAQEFEKFGNRIEEIPKE